MTGFAFGGDLSQAVNFGDDGGALGYAGLEQLFDAGKSGGDVDSGHAAGVEGTHGELCAGFTDALGGDDPNRRSVRHQLVSGQIEAVAGGADAPMRRAGQG